MKMLTLDQIGRICHEVNRAYCQSQGDDSLKPWDDCPQWQKDSTVLGVQKIMQSPEITPRDLHQAWWEHKIHSGWNYGAVKDEVLQTHPCMVPYDSLPENQRVKDYLFGAVVLACL